MELADLNRLHEADSRARGFVHYARALAITGNASEAVGRWNGSPTAPRKSSHSARPLWTYTRARRTPILPTRGWGARSSIRPRGRRFSGA